MTRRALGAAIVVVASVAGCGDGSGPAEDQRAEASAAVRIEAVRPDGATGTARLTAVGSSLVSVGFAWTEPYVQVSGDGGATWRASDIPEFTPDLSTSLTVVEVGGVAFAVGGQSADSSGKDPR